MLDNAAVTVKFTHFSISSRITVGIRLITRKGDLAYPDSRGVCEAHFDL